MHSLVHGPYFSVKADSPTQEQHLTHTDDSTPMWISYHQKHSREGRSASPAQWVPVCTPQKGPTIKLQKRPKVRPKHKWQCLREHKGNNEVHGMGKQIYIHTLYKLILPLSKTS